ncbi:MAG: GerW family sporulation protein [Bacillota bacterium]|nr:GerW family sporulation protein [Bacillota bacterium]NLJ03021.1 sporulation protein YtfJ [Bacillota bacterium]
MSDKHPIEGLMQTAMESLKTMVDVNTILGDPVETPDGAVILPVSRVSVGFAAGGSEFSGKESKQSEMGHPFGGGSGAGIALNPVAFLVVGKESVRLLPVSQNAIYDRLIDAVPQLIDQIQSAVQGRSSNGVLRTTYKV